MQPITALKPAFAKYTPTCRNFTMSATQPIEIPTGNYVETTVKITREAAIMTADLLDLSKAFAAMEAAVKIAQQSKAPMIGVLPAIMINMATAMRHKIVPTPPSVITQGRAA